MILLLVSISIRTFSAERIKIGVIDTGISLTDSNRKFFCKESKDFTGTGLEDHNGHGTNISGIISKHLDASKYCIVMIKYYDLKNDGLEAYLEALQYAITLNINFLNLSVEGYSYNTEEKALLAKITRNGVKVVVSAGNDAWDFDITGCIVFPACYPFKKNFYVVGSSNSRYSNRNGPVKYYENGTQEGFGIIKIGTSQAAAVLTNKLVRGLVK